ncbi:Protein CBG03537 [Caenorhabditis briggsae]|uniref:Protein CBG03537 n=1 Tax=Caenorhabditis briggsae TaxID=6238 RepID=A8WVA4_CAEBR|nr:Protein CBG03537 [Caenorhabditis briggsae]CAP24415.2 Protein CBG03537 [Caenorhabditis briggsae]
MRIRSYPNLVNQQIIQQMEPSANFMLAKTSKKMKDLVKNYIYKVDQVWVDSSTNVAFVIEIEPELSRKKKMRMRSYPCLVNRQIILEVDPSANFMLSKTSKKMKDLVKNNIYKVDQVWIDVSSYVAFIIEIDGKIHKVLGLRHDLAPSENIWYRFSLNMVLLRSPAVQQYHEILTNHNYICEIFKCESSRIPVIDSMENPEFPEEFSAQFLMDVDFCNLRNLGILPTNYRKIPNLMIDDVKYNVDDAIYLYEGRNIVLKNAWLDDGLARIFILRWMLKMKEDLVALIAFQDAQKVFDESSVVALLNEKRNSTTESRVEDWDPEKRDRYFKYDSIIANHYVFPTDTFDCEHGYDIVREDGKRATVKVSPNYFMFFVWP